MVKHLHISLKKADGSSLPAATVRLRARGDRKVYVFRANGLADLTCPLPKGSKWCRLEIGPVAGHWTIGDDVDLTRNNPYDAYARPLPEASDGLGWWHRSIGLRRPDLTAGRDIRIGVIDTGCASHPALSHIEPLGTFLGAQPPPADHIEINDELEHGTHVCGIIGARTENSKEFIGVAPAAELLVARVETAAAEGANQIDIANAIDAMVNRQVHLINISFGAYAASEVLIDSIINAWLQGVVCFAAVGNFGGTVLWPAQHEKVMAVTALGRHCEVPQGSLASLLLSGSTQTDSDVDVTFAEFCSRGPQTNCCSPGIGIISTIGTAGGGSWGDMSGTSMASPLALGTLAVILSADPAYLKSPADETRSQLAVEALQDHCRPLNLDTDVQGNGLLAIEF